MSEGSNEQTEVAKISPKSEINIKPEDPKHFIDFWRNRFIQLEREGKVDGVKQGTVNDFYW